MRFLAERQRWHDWRNDLEVYSSADNQANFYDYLRSNVDLDAQNDDAVIDHFITQWQRQSESHRLRACQ